MAKIPDLEDAYWAAKGSIGEDERRSDRDRIENILVGSIDEYWRQFSSNFNAQYGLLKTITDGGAASLASAAAVTTPTRAARVLAAVASGLIAFGTASQKDIFEGNAAYVLIGQMDADRQQVLATIKINLGKPTTEYSLNQMYIDIDNYGNTMSLPHALSSLNGKVGQQASDIQKSQYAVSPSAVVSIQPENLTVPIGQIQTFVASGGAGTGSYIWGGAATGTGETTNVSFTTAGIQKVTVYKSADSLNPVSNTATSVISVQTPPITTDFTPGNTTFKYNGHPQGPTITVTPDNATYTENGNLSASAIGSYSLTVTATGSYHGTKTISWTILAPNSP